MESADADRCGRCAAPLEERCADHRTSGDYSPGAGGADEYLDWAVPSYAKLYNTLMTHITSMLRGFCLHDTKSMVALPGRQYDMKGIGWQQEGLANGAGRARSRRRGTSVLAAMDFGKPPLWHQRFGRI